MITKKILLFCSIFVFFASFGYAMSMSDEESALLDQEVKEQNSFASELKTAKKYYFNGELDKADSTLNKIFAVTLDNEKANELKNKILLLKEKETYYKRVLVNDYLIELRRTVKDGNYYEGFLFIKKINSLSNEEELDSFYNRLVSEKELVLSTIENSGDKKIFLESIDAFVNEKFTKATRLIYKLYEKYPKFIDFLGMSRYYIIKETNNVRVKELYKKAIKNLKDNRFGVARNYAETAYSLEPDNIKLKLLIDQINMEII